MEELLSIGEFAQASGLSARALRLYAGKGLLVPRRVDPSNGYRWYSHSQLRAAEVIIVAREIRMPLAEIRELLADTPEGAHRRLDRQWTVLQDEVRRARSALARLYQEIAQVEEETMNEFERGNQLYFKERNIDEALQAYLAVTDDDPAYVTALRYIGHNIYGREWSRWTEGLPYLERAIAIAPEDPKLLEDIGRAYVAVGRVEEGRALLESAGTPIAAKALARLAGTA